MLFMSKHVTLKDVAEYAGVSVTTVSNVVRDWPYISPAMRTRVQQAIDKLGYTPHIVAQGLRTGQTQALAFIVPDLSNPYFAEIVSATEELAQQQGYTLLVFNSHEDAQREVACVQRAANRWADGLLIAHTTRTRNSPEFWKQAGIPIVAIDRVPADYDGPACALDNHQAGVIATEHLYDLGHRRIAHLAGPQTVRLALERREGYLQTLTKRGETYQRTLCASEMWDTAEGYRLMQELLDDPTPPTAVFSSNDRMAIGALHAICDRGLGVPQDISLIGVDDIEISEHLNPPLTTIRQPVEQLALHAVNMLLTLIRDETLDKPMILLEPKLIIRQSTGSPPKRN